MDDKRASTNITRHSYEEFEDILMGIGCFERETLGILYGHHYCFDREVSIITDHKPLITIFKKDVGTLSERLHQIVSGILQ